jgi:hypothetical protein
MQMCHKSISVVNKAAAVLNFPPIRPQMCPAMNGPTFVYPFNNFSTGLPM